MYILKKDQPFLVFDVESIGLHGEGFAVAGLIAVGGRITEEFIFSCDPSEASGGDQDRAWADRNVPELSYSHSNPYEVRAAFWSYWRSRLGRVPELVMACDCAWPVEARFLIDCAGDSPAERNWQGPYPLFDISSLLAAAGLGPISGYKRFPDELPVHDPLADARQSSRLLNMAIERLRANPELGHAKLDTDSPNSKAVGTAL